jgi:hypothetical protein
VMPISEVAFSWCPIDRRAVTTLVFLLELCPLSAFSNSGRWCPWRYAMLYASPMAASGFWMGESGISLSSTLFAPSCTRYSVTTTWCTPGHTERHYSVLVVSRIHGQSSISCNMKQQTDASRVAHHSSQLSWPRLTRALPFVSFLLLPATS